MIAKQARQHIVKLLNKTARLDGRQFTEYRKPISIEYNISKSAEGSARVQIGETIVLAGVKMEIGEPYPDTPNQGGLMVGAELLPLSNPEFESGPPGIQAIELSRVVDRAIREAKAIDVQKLCITEGELCWVVSIDICTLNDAGNLFDAAALAALAALKNARLPARDGKNIDYKKLTNEKLPLQKLPISVTVLKIADKFIVDPATEEEEVMDARLTVAVLDNGEICALQKGGNAALTIEDVESMIDIATEKSRELREVLDAE